MFLSVVLRGGHGAPPLLFPVPCGGWLYWVIPLVASSVLAALVYSAGRRLAAENVAKVEAKFEFAFGDPRWEGKNLSVLPLICTLAGVAAGGLGVGGAMVKGPLMLEMGMQPAVSSATATFMILFTSSLTTLQFLVAGLLRLDYTLFYACIGALGTIAGQKSVGALVKRFKRQSILSLALGVNIAVSTVVMGIVGGAQIVTDALAANWDAFSFQPLCHG